MNEAIAKELLGAVQKNKSTRKHHETDSKSANLLQKLAKTEELKRILARSDLNTQGYFNPDTRRESASVL